MVKMSFWFQYLQMNIRDLEQHAVSLIECPCQEASTGVYTVSKGHVEFETGWEMSADGATDVVGEALGLS